MIADLCIPAYTEVPRTVRDSRFLLITSRFLLCTRRNIGSGIVMSMPALLALLFDLLLPPAFRSMASGELEELVVERLVEDREAWML